MLTDECEEKGVFPVSLVLDYELHTALRQLQLERQLALGKAPSLSSVVRAALRSHLAPQLRPSTRGGR